MKRRTFLSAAAAAVMSCSGFSGFPSAAFPLSSATIPAIEVAQFKDATEIVWKVADYLYAAKLGGAPPTRRFVADANEAHSLSLSGAVPVVGMSFDDVLDCARSGDANAGQITAFYGVHRGFLSLISQGGIDGVGALRGRSIAVDTYSGYASALFEILAGAGLDYETDVTVVLAGATNLRFAKLLNGDFAATLLGTPFDLLAQAQGFRSLAGMVASLGGYQGLMLAAHRSWLDRNGDSARALTAVFAHALAWAGRTENRPALRGILRSGLAVPASDAVIDQVADRLFGPTTEFCPPGTVSRSDLTVVRTLFAKYRNADLSGFDPASVIDARFLTVV